MIAPPLLFHDPVDANDELHVFADRLRVESADIDQRRASEHAERTGHDQDGAQRLPSHATEEKRTQVLDDLHECQRISRQRHLLEKAVAQRAAVGDTDSAACRHCFRILEKGAYRAPQGVALEHAVRIDDRDQRIAADVDAGVGRVGFGATVFLVDDAQIAVARGPIGRPDLPTGDLLAVGLGVRVELKPRDELIEGVVGRAVVDHDNLEVRVLELQECLDGSHDRPRFVIRGHDKADRQMHRRIDLIDIVDRRRLQIAPNAADSEQTLNEVSEVDRREVREKNPFDRRYEGPRHQRMPASAIAWPRMSLA